MVGIIAAGKEAFQLDEAPRPSTPGGTFGRRFEIAPLLTTYVEGRSRLICLQPAKNLFLHGSRTLGWVGSKAGYRSSIIQHLPDRAGLGLVTRYRVILFPLPEYRYSFGHRNSLRLFPHRVAIRTKSGGDDGHV